MFDVQPPPLPWAAAFLFQPLTLKAGKAKREIPESCEAQRLIGAKQPLTRLPGHDVFVAEQPPQEPQIRVFALLYPFFISFLIS